MKNFSSGTDMSQYSPIHSVAINKGLREGRKIALKTVQHQVDLAAARKFQKEDPAGYSSFKNANRGLEYTQEDEDHFQATYNK